MAERRLTRYALVARAMSALGQPRPCWMSMRIQATLPLSVSNRTIRVVSRLRHGIAAPTKPTSSFGMLLVDRLCLSAFDQGHQPAVLILRRVATSESEAKRRYPSCTLPENLSVK